MTKGYKSLTTGRMMEQIVSFIEVTLVQVIFDRLISLMGGQSSKVDFTKFGSSTANNLELYMCSLDYSHPEVSAQLAEEFYSKVICC